LTVWHTRSGWRASGREVGRLRWHQPADAPSPWIEAKIFGSPDGIRLSFSIVGCL
jgi:hypothetical protein